jgi:kynurenine 3-monooxygenase
LRDRAVKRGLLACTGVPDSMVFKIAELGRVDGFFDPPAASSDANDPGLFRTFPSNQPLCSVLAPPRRDGQVHAVLVMPAAGGFDKYFHDEASIARSFERFFPFVFGPAGPPPSVVASLKAQPASTGGVTTCCSRYDVGEACVIIGDSAHSCWPSLGQSCNAGLESVSVLGAALFSSADGGPPVNGALAERLCLYSAVRKPDADAVGQLSERGFGKNSRVLTKRALLRIATMVLLSKLFPGTPFLVPALFDLDKPSVAYAAILRKQQRQDAFVDMCVLAVTILAAAVGLASFS